MALARPLPARGEWRSRLRRPAWAASKYLLLAPFLLFALFPFYFMLLTSLKSDLEIYDRKAVLFLAPHGLLSDGPQGGGGVRHGGRRHADPGDAPDRPPGRHPRPDLRRALRLPALLERVHLILVMLETAQAVKNARDILSVPGIDGCFIGPNDLGISFGIPPGGPDPRPPTEEAATQEILEAARACGAAAGIQAYSPEGANLRLRQGFRFVGIGSDVQMVQHGARAMLGGIQRPAA